jgi:GTP-binding protein Era
MKSGFVSIFGRPNAGKSTLLNAVMGEKLAIISPKVQTTRHRIRAFLNGEGYQVILSDTPGIIKPEYKLHEKMMKAVKSSLEDADLAILITDVRDKPELSHEVFQALRLKVPAVVIVNKCDKVKPEEAAKVAEFFRQQSYCKEVLTLSAAKLTDWKPLLDIILKYLPEGDPFFPEDEMTDLPTRFFVGEMVREKIYGLFEDEIPYQTAVMVTDFKEKQSLVKITAEIIVQRESQKAIILGEGGKMIRKLGTDARKDIEAFLGSKVFLELFVKVRPKWRDNEIHLREYGYGS